MRKRIGVMVLAGTIAACSTVGWAEETSGTGINLSAYTLDQLVELRNEINELLDEGLGETDNISTGYYVAGVDIRVGSYDIAPAREDSIDVIILPTLEDYTNRVSDNALYFSLYCEDEEAEHSTISLKDGNVLVIQGDAVIKNVKPSWSL